MPDDRERLRATFDSAADSYQRARPSYPAILYDELIRPGGAWSRPGEIADEREEIEASGGFDVVLVRHFDWEVVYDTEGYLALLDTFSGHIAMEPWQRERSYGEVHRRLALRPDGRVHRHWGAMLHVARRRENTPGAGDAENLRSGDG